jgi:hypothetical protein
MIYVVTRCFERREMSFTRCSRPVLAVCVLCARRPSSAGSGKVALDPDKPCPQQVNVAHATRLKNGMQAGAVMGGGATTAVGFTLASRILPGFCADRKLLGLPTTTRAGDPSACGLWGRLRLLLEHAAVDGFRQEGVRVAPAGG